MWAEACSWERSFKDAVSVGVTKVGAGLAGGKGGKVEGGKGGGRGWLIDDGRWEGERLNEHRLQLGPNPNWPRGCFVCLQNGLIRKVYSGSSQRDRSFNRIQGNGDRERKDKAVVSSPGLSSSSHLCAEMAARPSTPPCPPSSTSQRSSSLPSESQDRLEPRSSMARRRDSRPRRVWTRRRTLSTSVGRPSRPARAHLSELTHAPAFP